MTSRLKHKLELENVNLKSAYINESFVQVSALKSRQRRMIDLRLERHCRPWRITRKIS